MCTVNLHIFFQLIFVSVQRTAQTSFEIFLQTRIMVDGAKFNRYDSGSHFKKWTFRIATERKIDIFATELKLRVRLSMQSLHRFSLLIVKNLKNMNIYDKKIWPVYCSAKASRLSQFLFCYACRATFNLKLIKVKITLGYRPIQNNTILKVTT